MSTSGLVHPSKGTAQSYRVRSMSMGHLVVICSPQVLDPREMVMGDSDEDDDGIDEDDEEDDEQQVICMKPSARLAHSRVLGEKVSGARIRACKEPVYGCDTHASSRSAYAAGHGTRAAQQFVRVQRGGAA